MRGDEAKEVCPSIQLVQVPVARGKADLNPYREAGSEVLLMYWLLFLKNLCKMFSATSSTSDMLTSFILR